MNAALLHEKCTALTQNNLGWMLVRLTRRSRMAASQSAVMNESKAQKAFTTTKV